MKLLTSPLNLGYEASQKGPGVTRRSRFKCQASVQTKQASSAPGSLFFIGLESKARNV